MHSFARIKKNTPTYAPPPSHLLLYQYRRQITDNCCVIAFRGWMMCVEVEIFFVHISCAFFWKMRVTWWLNYWSRGAIGYLLRRDGRRSSADCSFGDGRSSVAARGQTKVRSDAPVLRLKSTPPGDGDSRSRRRISSAVLRGAWEPFIFYYWPIGYGVSASGSAGASGRWALHCDLWNVFAKKRANAN